MSRIIIAVASIVVAFAICFTGYFSVNKACKELEASLNEICEFARNGEKEKAIEQSYNTLEQWENKHSLIESFIRHEETDNLEELIKSLSVYAEQHNMERLEQQADLAVDELHHLIRSEQPLISNIF